MKKRNVLPLGPPDVIKLQHIGEPLIEPPTINTSNGQLDRVHKNSSLAITFLVAAWVAVTIRLGFPASHLHAARATASIALAGTMLVGLLGSERLAIVLEAQATSNKRSLAAFGYARPHSESIARHTECVRLFSIKYEDLSRADRAKLLLEDEAAYFALLGEEQWLCILDGMAKAKPFIPPPPEKEETWRRMLRPKN